MTFAERLTFSDWHSLLWTCTRDAQVRDRDGTLLLLRNELCISISERPGRWRARHRRGLHRLGFRPLPSAGLCVWLWTLSMDELRVAARSHPLMKAAGPRTRVLERLAWSGTREQLMRDQLRRVLSDVFGFDPAQLCVELPPDEDDWEDEDDLDVAGVG